MFKIVVGFDGSECSLLALRWAMTEAVARHDATVTVVTVVEPRQVPSLSTAAVWERPPDSDVVAARDHAQEAVGKVRADLDVAVGTGVRELVGHAGKTLVDAAADADLLVVGSHGCSAVREMLLGSVSMFAVHHAACPVTVVRSAQ